MPASSPLTRVPGFRAVGLPCGLKQSGQPDLALLVAAQPCTAAALFTTNAFKAAPVLYDMALLERTKTLQAVVVNAGNANAVTGAQGLRDAERMARLTEQICGLPVDSTFVMSTGIIGHSLDMAKIEQGLRRAGDLLMSDQGARGLHVADAILTTDLVTKEAFHQTRIDDRLISIGGVAKGSGMIHPDMATMLAMLVTDALIEPATLHKALHQAVAGTFNRISVDGDTSTNDTVVILASGQAGRPAIGPDTPQFEAFCTALTEVCLNLARAVARDGEGATKLLEISVKGAATEADADKAAKTVATSPLFKTAMFGNDPNWGRALAALGRSGVTVDPARVSLWLGDFKLVEAGAPLAFEAVAVNRWLEAADTVQVIIDLQVASAEATVWSCDFSYKYVEINAEYHT